jgi:cytochrome c oxidase subunit IV
MSQHHSEHNTQHYYEGDQSKLYSGVMNHHFGSDLKSAESKSQVKRILKVTVILSIVTIVEVIIGMFFSSKLPSGVSAFFFLALTLLKAGYIVSVFMHLGDELKNFLITVLIPLTLFIWFVIAFLADGGFWLHMNQTTPTRTTQQVVQPK